MERELPTFDIEGTTFVVDVLRNELHERDNPINNISFSQLRDVPDGYLIEYNPQTRNVADPWDDETELISVVLPQLTSLDPEGMAKKYGYSSTEDIQGKTDLEVLMGQEALKERLRGKLPTLDILGHTFYVDIFMNCIRPKDDFTTLGINLQDLEDYLDEETARYRFPYNPQKHQMERLDYYTITSIPKGIVPIEFPYEKELDPVGYARAHGFDLEEVLLEAPMKAHSQAKVITWEDLYVPQIIQENIEWKKMEGQDTDKPDEDEELKHGRGR
ncbi:MAG: hypothetical protein QHC79_25815 [Pseudosphingobacterium sp.]|nr:hypothetical protein [Pseudosphingobacterium sp.]